jgi:AbrB family looped-hinge helix DNA binding protein
MPYNNLKCKENAMPEAAVTSKGQITIPAEIRRQMNLGPQDRVVFTLLPNGTAVMRAKNRSISSLAGSVKSTQQRVPVKDMKMR